jgi:hypothetical protein
VWKSTGFIVGVLLGSLVALLSWLATSDTSESRPPSSASKPLLPPRLRQTTGRVLSLPLDGLPGQAVRPLEAWGPVEDSGRLVIALDVLVRLQTTTTTRGLDVWLVNEWGGGRPSRAPDLTIKGTIQSWDDSSQAYRLSPVPYPFAIVVQNSGPPIVAGVIEVAEVVAEIY